MSGNNCSVTRCHILEERIYRMSHRFVLKTFFLRVAHNKNLLIHSAASFPAFRTHRKCRNARTHNVCHSFHTSFGFKFRYISLIYITIFSVLLFQNMLLSQSGVSRGTFVIIIVIIMTIIIIGILPCMMESRTASRVWCGILK